MYLNLNRWRDINEQKCKY